MTPHRSQFRQYSAQHSDSVRVGNSQHCAIIGIITIELNLPDGSALVLHNVRHVPKLSRPLITVGQLDEDGIRVGFSSGGWTLHKGNLLLARELIEENRAWPQPSPTSNGRLNGNIVILDFIYVSIDDTGCLRGKPN